MLHCALRSVPWVLLKNAGARTLLFVLASRARLDFCKDGSGADVHWVAGLVVGLCVHALSLALTEANTLRPSSVDFGLLSLYSLLASNWDCRKWGQDGRRVTWSVLTWLPIYF